MKERVTVDFDEQSYYLDGEFWESWDNYGEEMAEKINELLNELAEENKQCKEYNTKLYSNSMKSEKQLLKQIKELEKENKELKKRLSNAEKVNTGLIDENHRLRLTIVHSSDLNFDIEWLKENLKEDWNNE